MDATTKIPTIRRPLPRPRTIPADTFARIIETLGENGVSQTEFAERFGVTRQTVWNWTKGRFPVPGWIRIVLLLEFPEELAEIRF